MKVGDVLYPNIEKLEKRNANHLYSNYYNIEDHKKADHYIFVKDYLKSTVEGLERIKITLHDEKGNSFTTKTVLLEDVDFNPVTKVENNLSNLIEKWKQK